MRFLYDVPLETGKSVNVGDRLFAVRNETDRDILVHLEENLYEKTFIHNKHAAGGGINYR